MDTIEPRGTVAYDATSASALTLQATAAFTSLSELVIDSDDMYQIAADELKAVKSLQKTVEERRTAITGPINVALKSVNDLFRAPKEYLEKAEAAVKRSMVTWSTEQDRLAAVARREAERLAQAERERLAAIQREQQEAAAAAARASAAAHHAAMAAAAAGDAKAQAAAQAEAEAQAEIASSAQADAQETAMTAEIVTFAPAVSAPAKVTGIAGRVTYSAEVTNLMELIQAVAAGKAPIQCIVADEKFLGAQARAFKAKGDLYPGVVCRAERGISARAA